LPSNIRLQAVSAATWFIGLVASLLLILCAAPAAGLRVSFDPIPTTKALSLLGVFALLAWKARTIMPRVALVASSFVVIWGGALAGGALCMIAAMFRFPLIDPWLAAADTWLGINTVDVVRLVVAIPFAPKLLYSIYFLSVVLLFGTAFALACLDRAERLWEFCAAYGFCLLVATLCSLPLPATGAFEYLRLDAVYGSRLPPGSGVYWLEALHAVRSSSSMVINPLGLHGLVAFPSFHTGMALMTAAAWRDDRFLRWPMFVWNGLVLVSTMPIGGHYIVDVMAGALTWFVIFRYGAGWTGAMLSLRSRLTKVPAAAPSPEAAHVRSVG